MPKIFVASFNRASDGAVSLLNEKLEKNGMLNVFPYRADYILACGDRKETFEYCLKWYQKNLPIIHLWAGEVSQGTHDEVYRWAITNMSMMQLCTNPEASARVSAFCGAIDKKFNAYIVGNVMLDNMEIDNRISGYIDNLVLYNPPTNLTDKEINKELANMVIDYDLTNDNTVWLEPNGDSGSNLIAEYVNREKVHRPQFLGLLKNCNRFITNSSCADYEAPFVGLKPHQIIRIGERNKNRESQVSDMTIPNASDNIIKILKTLDKKEWEYPVCEHMVTNKYGWCVSNPENFMLEKDTDIGWGTYINASYGVVIEEGVQIGGGCHIYSDNTIDKTHGEVHIGKNATIGAHCVILPDVHIGENAYIPAGAIVSKDVPANSSLLRVA